MSRRLLVPIRSALPRLAKWLGLTVACALPLGFLAWAALQGVAWIAAVDHALVRVLALSLYSIALIPFAVVAALACFALQFVPDVATPESTLPFEAVEFVAVFLMTTCCALPTLLAGIYATNLIELLRRPVVSLARRRGADGSGRSP